MTVSRGTAAAVAVALTTIPASAWADPEVSVAVAGGLGAHVSRDGRAAFEGQLGLRADVLFLRTRDREWALGPYIEAMSRDFRTVEPGAGLDVLVPLPRSLSLVASAGGAAGWSAAGGWTPEGVATVFVGSRGYNFDNPYNLTLGVYAQTRVAFDRPDVQFVVGVEVDSVYFALPFVLLYNAIAR